MGRDKGKRSGAASRDQKPSDGDAEQRKRRRLEADRAALPVWAARDALVAAARASPVLIVVGETGSGKTTQLPKLLLDAGLAGARLAACTQPRRVAAVTVAARVADEAGVRLGGAVGYAVRFEDATSAETRLKYCTDGVLLREAVADPALRRYGLVVVDEAHERSVATDVLLGLLKAAAAAREKTPAPLRLVVMSATLDAAAFTAFFPGAAAVAVRGRQHPVEVLYAAQPVASYVDAAVGAALQAHAEEAFPGDVLVFLTGQDEIEAAAALLRERAAALAAAAAAGGGGGAAAAAAPALLVVPLYAALPPEAQLRAFRPAPKGTRKVILATNIAETSVTVPGVRYVVDPGFVKARAYAPGAGAEVLRVVPVSRAQARQRAGRAGREAPGKCFRLYTEDAYAALEAAAPPEIARANLASTVLSLKALGVADVLAFALPTPPPRGALLRAVEALLALGALEPGGGLARPLGARLARLPLDPPLGRALLAAAAAGAGAAEDALLALGAAAADAPVFASPRGARDAAAAAHARFASRHGDHAALLRAARAHAGVPPAERAAWCRANFLSARALGRGAAIADQLRGHLRELGVLAAPAPAPQAATAGAGAADSDGDGDGDAVALRRALCAGLFASAARRQPDGSYLALASRQRVHVHPSSALAALPTAARPAVIVFGELVHTARPYARLCTGVEPGWLAEAAPAFWARRAAGGGAAG